MSLNKNIALHKSKDFYSFLKSREFAHFLLIPFVIYVYFLKWKLTSIHDDDLYIYSTYTGLKGFSQQSNMSLVYGQYRPVRDLALHILFQLFRNDLTALYSFNVVIQSINTILFAYLVNLLLRSMSISLFLSLILGLSRFCYYNLTQLFNGGVLEGLALTFFLSLLYCMVKVAIKPDVTVPEQRKGILWGILFANLGMYTHERYIAVFPFLLLMILFFPKFKRISVRSRIGLSFLAIASIILNIIIKTYVYRIRFFVGTGSTHIDFSFSKAIKYLFEAVCSVFQYNIGPEWLSGFQFIDLPPIYMVLVFLIICLILGVLGLYLWKAAAGLLSGQRNYPPNIALFIFLPVIFFLTLVPCIFQGRIELRWLQAPLSVLVLLFAIALAGLTDKNNNLKYLLSFLLGISFLCTNYYYLDKGAKNLYYSTSARIGNAFDKAIKDSAIHLGKSDLYVWEKKRNFQREDEIKWSIANGAFFEPYQGRRMNVIFADSLYSLSNFNGKDDQIIYLDIQRDGETFNYSITDITKEYLRDSLHKFDEERFDRVDPSMVHYDQKEMVIQNETFKYFTLEGFHENENGVRWTNGKAHIHFTSDYTAKDSLNMELDTYMPPICKNVSIRPSITDSSGKEYRPVTSKREADRFFYNFYFERPVKIRAINILSDTINAAPDLRTMSFLFVSLKLKK